MHKLWPIIERVLTELEPHVVVQVGAADGKNTAKLLRYARDRRSTVHLVDVVRQFDHEDLVRRCGGTLVCHWEPSVDALPRLIPDADAILLDGDHNWYVVHSELSLIDELAPADRFPIVLFHDVGWPWGHRDGYADIEAIPPQYRHPHGRRGLLPGDRGTVEQGGLLADELKALREGGPRNGVRAAIDDLLAETQRDVAYAELPGFHGLGLLCERAVLTGPLAWFRDLADNEAVSAQMRALERERLDLWRVTEERLGALEQQRERIAVLQASEGARQQRVGELQQTLSEREVTLAVIRSGRSWRLTEPLRRIAGYRRSARRRRSDLRIQQQRVGVPLASLEWSEAYSSEPARYPVRWAEPLSIAGQRRLPLEQHPPSRVAYRLKLPAGSVFSTDVAVRPEAWSRGAPVARFAVTLMTADGERMSTSTLELTPSKTVAHRRWVRMTLELPASPQDALIVLETESVGDPPESLNVAWGDPTIHVPVTEARAAAAPVGGEQVLAGADANASAMRNPLISVLMPVHDPPPRFLDQAIRSVLAQTYSNWELCLLDDASQDPRVPALLRDHASRDDRISLVQHEQSGGISAATNAALQLARGEFVAFFDHDDVLAPDALKYVVEHLQAHPGTDVLYTDEDRILPDGARLVPEFKPDWSPELLLGAMYTGHLGVFSRALVERVGGLRSEYDGSQDYDLMLRCSEHAQRIGHVPKLVYHWRVHGSSVALNPHSKLYAYEAAQRALDDHLARAGIDASVERTTSWGLYRTMHRVSPDEDVSVVIALREDALDADGIAELRRCLVAMAAQAGLPFDVVCVVASEQAARWEEVIGDGTTTRPRFVETDASLGPAAMLGAGARSARGRHLLLMSDLCAPRSADWLRELVGYSRQDEIGAVGAKVVKSDATILHGGVVIGKGLPLAVHRGAPADSAGYIMRLAVASNYLAVDGVVITRRALYERLGGLTGGDPTMAISDYCLRAGEQGLRVVFAPAAEFTLASPERPTSPALLDELARFKYRWEARVPRDPYYHPEFVQVRASFPAGATADDDDVEEATPLFPLFDGGDPTSQPLGDPGRLVVEDQEADHTH